MRKLALLFVFAGFGVAVIAATALAARTHHGPFEVRATVWAVERFDGRVNTVTAFDASTGLVRCTAAVGKRPIGVAVPLHTGKVYTADERSNQLTVLSKRDCSVLKQIPTGALPHHALPSRDGRSLYFGEYGTNKVGVVDTHTDTLVAEWTASRDPLAKTHAVWIRGDDLYATNEGATQSAMGTLSKLDAETGQPSGRCRSGSGRARSREPAHRVRDGQERERSQGARPARGRVAGGRERSRDRRNAGHDAAHARSQDTRGRATRDPADGVAGHAVARGSARDVRGVRHQRPPVAGPGRPLHVHRARERGDDQARGDRDGRQPVRPGRPDLDYPSGPWPHGLVFDRKVLR